MAHGLQTTVTLCRGHPIPSMHSTARGTVAVAMHHDEGKRSLLATKVMQALCHGFPVLTLTSCGCMLARTACDPSATTHVRLSVMIRDKLVFHHHGTIGLILFFHF